jgi:hypothetical protein
VRVFRQKFTLEDAIGSHACSLEANTRVTNGTPLGSSLLLPVDTVNCVQTLKVIVLASCFVVGFLCSTLTMPPLIGYVCAGTIVGPAGYNLIMSVVQVSTLGEFGVFLVRCSGLNR